MSKLMDRFVKRTKRDMSDFVAPPRREKKGAQQRAADAADANRCFHGKLPPDDTLYRAELRHREYPFNFLRPPYTQPTHNKEPLEFFIEQIDTVNTLTPLWDVLEKYKGRESVKRNYWSFYVRLFGTTAEGHNVCCYLSGFHPHIYIEVPHDWNDAHVEQWIEALEEETGLDKLSWNVAQWQLVWRKNIYGFTKDTPIRMLKLAFKNMSTKRKVCDLLRSEPKSDFDAPPPDRTRVPPQRYKYHGAPQHRFWLYDLNVSEPQQLLNETGIGGCRWVRLEGGAYKFHNMAHVLPHERRSRAQIDIDAPYGTVHVLHERKDVPPLLIYSLDSEVMRGARDRVFPKSHVAGDEQFQWGGSVMRFGDEFEHIPLFSAVHCVRPTDNLQPDKMHVNEYADERSMLAAYLRFFRDAVNPSVVIGYNTYGFDYKYWEDRAKRCLTSAHSERNLPYKYGAYERGLFEYGIVRGELSESRESYGGSKAHGSRETCQIAMAGRTQIDLFKWAAEEWKMPRTLNWVGEDTFANASLGDSSLCKDDFCKLELPFYVLHDKYVGTARDRGEIAEYCAVDTHVPLRIVHVKKVLLGIIEIARLTGLTMHDVINKKQMARTFAMISKYAHDRKYVIPECPQRFVRDAHLRNMMFGDGSYQGATVINPQRGYYDACVGTLDYAGLYPSIIRGFHLCYTTLVLDPKWLNDPDVELRSIEIQSDQPGVAPYKLHWVTNTEPLLYGMLTEILNARANAKRLKKQHAGNPFLHALYDARQRALKLEANSTYGFLGAGKVGKLPMVALAASVTYHGRELIELTRDIVHREQPECRVIYGDSVTGDTPIYLLVDGRLEIVRFDCVATLLALEWTPFCATKESLEFDEHSLDVQVWSDGGFARVKRFIRHRLAPEKSLMRVSTHTGIVDVTEDHSLLRAGDAHRLTPHDLIVNETELLHEREDALLLEKLGSSGDEIVGDDEAFMLGISFGAAHIDRENDQVEWRFAMAEHHTLADLREWWERCCAKALPIATECYVKDIFFVCRLQCDVPRAERAQFVRRLSTFLCDDSGVGGFYVPDAILRGNLVAAREFANGMCGGARGCGVMCGHAHSGCMWVDGKTQAAQIWLLRRRLGYNVVFVYALDRNCFRLVWNERKESKRYNDSRVLAVERLSSDGVEHVYDIETASSHFHVAPGNLVVHNTDSVMIRFPKAWSKQHVFDVSHQLADIVTREIGKSEILLEFEKIYDGYLLYLKKKYAGMKMERIDQKPHLAIKGLNPVRGDKMPLVKRISTEILNALLIDKSAQKAIECLQAALQAMVDDKLPPSDFYQEKKLTKALDEYPPNTVHVRVARAMRERDPGTAPGAGEMVKFLVVEGPLKVNAVDYDHFMKNRRRYRLDYEYYLQNLMLESLGDLLNLEGVHDDPYRLFEPYLALARARKMRTPQITQFLVRRTSADKAQFVQMRGMKRGPSKTKVKKQKERANKNHF